jgi:type IV secretory pathway VirJ component
LALFASPWTSYLESGSHRLTPEEHDMGKKTGLVIKRSLFGYRRSAVHELLLESDYMQRKAESDILAAEAKVAELQSDLDAMNREVARRDDDLRSLEAEVARLEDHATEGGPLYVTDEVRSILAAAHEAAARIVSRARSVSERIQLANSRDHRLQADVARLAAWREEALPVIRSVRSSVEGVRSQIDGAAQRLADALAPLQELGSVDEVSEGEVGEDAHLEIEEPGGEADRLRVIEPPPDDSAGTPSKRVRSSRKKRAAEPDVKELTG